MAAFCLLLACFRNESNEPVPALATIKPVRQLGSSEFRLSRRDGFERPFCFSPDGKMIAAANWDEVRVWSFPDGKLLHDFTDKIDSRCIAFSEDGKELLALEQREMSIYRFEIHSGILKSKTQLADVIREKGHTRYWLSSGGHWICTTEVYSHVTVWDTKTGKRMLRMQMRNLEPYRAPVTRDGILTVWDNLFLERYEVSTGKLLSNSRHYRKLLNPISNADGTVMAAYSTEDKSIVFWDSKSGERFGGKIPTGERDWMPDQAALSADGKRLVFWVSDGETVFDRRMAVFDVETGKLINSFPTPDSLLIQDPIISPDGAFVFSTESCVVFTPVQVNTGQPVHDYPDHVLPVECLSFTPDGKLLLAGSTDRRQAWEVNTGLVKANLSRSPRQPFVLAVDNDHALVVGLQNLGIQLIEIANALVKEEFKAGKSFSQLVLAQDRKSSVGIQHGTKGRSVIRWDPFLGKVLASWNMPGDGREMATYNRYAFRGLALHGSRLIRFREIEPAKKLSDGSFDWGRREMLLEDWATQQVTNRLTFHANSPHAITDAADNNILAIVASDDWHGAHNTNKIGSTYLWITDLSTDKERFLVARNRKDYWSAFSHVALSRDSRLVATVSHTDRIELWNGYTGELLQQLDAPNAVALIEFSDDGAMLASGHQDGRICLWNTNAAHELVQPD